MGNTPIVVVRDEATLQSLVHDASIGFVGTFVVDRRTRDRRGPGPDSSVERRRADRRQQDVSAALERDGFAIVEASRTTVNLDEALE
jgi:hypothetical protein